MLDYKRTKYFLALKKYNKLKNKGSTFSLTLCPDFGEYPRLSDSIPEEEILRIMTRYDQKDEKEFKCDSYKNKSIESKK